MSATAVNASTMRPNNLAADLKSPAAAASETTSKPKPCCVCTTEKSARDECMLFSTAAEPQEACRDLVGSYKACMKGYGFDIA